MGWDAKVNKTKLKPCPCGKIPPDLSIVDNGSKWAYVYGDCCGEWHIEFRTMYNSIESTKCKKLAIEAWNNSSRAEETPK